MSLNQLLSPIRARPFPILPSLPGLSDRGFQKFNSGWSWVVFDCKKTSTRSSLAGVAWNNVLLRFTEKLYWFVVFVCVFTATFRKSSDEINFQWFFGGSLCAQLVIIQLVAN